MGFWAIRILRRCFPSEDNLQNPPCLALATVLQYIEGLSDRQTADAVRSRIDWKYLLSLELTDTGFHHTVLSEFRTRLVTEQAAGLILDFLQIRLCNPDAASNEL